MKSRLDDDKTARKVIAPALLLIQAEKLGANEITLRYFAAAVSGAIDGDGYVSAAEGKVVLTSGKHAVALLWGCCLSGARHRGGSEGREGFNAVASGGAVKLASLYSLYGPPLLEGDEGIINYKLAGAVELGPRGLTSAGRG